MEECGMIAADEEEEGDDAAGLRNPYEELTELLEKINVFPKHIHRHNKSSSIPTK